MKKEENHYTRLMDYTRQGYRQYNDYFKILPEDKFFQKIIKLFGRFIVLIIMILLSPVLFIGLSIAVAAVF